MHSTLMGWDKGKYNIDTSLLMSLKAIAGGGLIVPACIKITMKSIKSFPYDMTSRMELHCSLRVVTHCHSYVLTVRWLDALKNCCRSLDCEFW